MRLPPGPRAPAVVNSARITRRPIEFLTGLHRRYGPVVTVSYLVFGKGVYVADQEAIRAMFSGDQSDLHAGEANAVLTPALGTHSVLVLDGPEHLRHRRLLLPPLKGSAVHESRPVIRAVAEAEVARWRPGDALVLRERMRAITFEVIARIVFGVTDAERIARLRTALTAVVDSTTTLALPGVMRVPIGPWRRFERRRDAADVLVYEEIAARRAAGPGDGRDVLSLLLQARDEDGRGFTNTELRDELMTMLLAGHETTATALAFALDLLLHHPDALARARAGEDAYLDAVGAETLRVRPIIDAVERTLQRPRTVCGHELPAGIRVYPSIVGTHFDPVLHPEPHAFRPERFLDGAKPPWMPFGGGIRRCIGAALAEAELAEVLRTVLDRVRLEPVAGAPDPVVMHGITLVPRHGVRVRVV